MEQSGVYGHSRSRTTSSNVIPGPPFAQQPMPPQQYAHQQRQHQPMPQQYHPHPHQQHHPQHQQQHQVPPGNAQQHWRRSPSINTFSTSSTFQPPAAYRNSSSTDLRRSTSSRSVNTAQGSSYVALLRKQKATVWCERAQYEDPHLLAQQRAAKMRANLEVVSGYGNGRTRTGLSATGKVAAKIRHGKTPMIGYAPGETHVGVGGVPKRLLESDGDQESDEEDDTPYNHQRPQHNRAGSSGRSSTGSGQRGLTYRTSSGPIPPQVTRHSSGSTPERTASLAKDTAPLTTTTTINDNVSGRAPSSGSGGSERLDSVADLGRAPNAAANSTLNSALTREKSVKTADELKRRGSVDERSGTLTGGRLFIANPD